MVKREFDRVNLPLEVVIFEALPFHTSDEGKAESISASRLQALKPSGDTTSPPK
jgi:hypothetical protein